jgi:hypothetical protein
MLGILLIAVALWLLFGDATVKSQSGAGNKIKAVASGVKKVATNQTGAPKPSQDFFGWLFYKGN